MLPLALTFYLICSFSALPPPLSFIFSPLDQLPHSKSFKIFIIASFTQVPGAAPTVAGTLPFAAQGGINATAPPTLALGATKPTDPWGKPATAAFGAVGFGAVGKIRF